MSDGIEQHPNSPLLDVRPEPAFFAGHALGASSIPLEELPRRVHELPAADHPLRITDADPARAREAAAFLTRRGHAVVAVPWDILALDERGPSRVRLWRPSPFLVEALEVIDSLDPHGACSLPRRAMDVACGTGRDAVYLALRGYDVLAADILPDALERASDLALRNGTSIRTLTMDVERGPSLPCAPFELVTVFRFLHRPLFPLLRDAIAPGGWIIYETFHEQNLSTGQGPRKLDHLLRTGELAAAFGDLEIRIVRDAFSRAGRYFASLLARKCS